MGDYEARLTALRDALTVSLEKAPVYAKAPLARQLIDVLGRLEAMHPLVEADRVDDLATARADRRAGTTDLPTAQAGGT